MLQSNKQKSAPGPVLIVLYSTTSPGQLLEFGATFGGYRHLEQVVPF